MKIDYSIIIPTLNEEKNISKLLNQLEYFRRSINELVEIIIVDGDSKDKTLEICKQYNVKIINSIAGRGIQMNKGVKYANGNVMIFIHADTSLPFNILRKINNNFDRNDKVATFTVKFDNDHILYKLYSYFTNFDSIFTTFGDQIIIVRRNFYFRIGGFPNLKLLEDVEFLRKARKITTINKLKEKVITSSRRFEKFGIINTQIKNFIIIYQYLIGTTPDILFEKYYNLENEKKCNNNFRKISSSRESKNQISLINQ